MAENQPEPRLQPLGDLADGFMAEAAERHEAHITGKPLGPVTGFSSLDKEMGGRLFPGLHPLSAAPGVGKTAFGWQVAARCGFPAIFVSCEMGMNEMLARAISRETGEYLGKIKSGELPPAKVGELLRRTVDKLRQVYLVDATSVWPSPAWLTEAIDAARGDQSHALVVVDSLHTWSHGLVEDGSKMGEYEILSKALDVLRGVAIAQGIPILGIAERNRATMEKGGMHASAGTRAFEYCAETVIALDKEGDRPQLGGGSIPVIEVKASLSKNRHGSPCTVKLNWEGRCQRFSEV